MPNGGRNHFGAAPSGPFSASLHRAISCARSAPPVPEKIGMRLGMVADEVTTIRDFSHQFRTLARESPNHKKCSAHAGTLSKQLQQLGVIFGFGPSSNVIASFRGEFV